MFGGKREVVDPTLKRIWAKAVWRVTLRALVHRRGKEKAETVEELREQKTA